MLNSVRQVLPNYWAQYRWLVKLLNRYLQATGHHHYSQANGIRSWIYVVFQAARWHHPQDRWSDNRLRRSLFRSQNAADASGENGLQSRVYSTRIHRAEDQTNRRQQGSNRSVCFRASFELCGHLSCFPFAVDNYRTDLSLHATDVRKKI